MKKVTFLTFIFVMIFSSICTAEKFLEPWSDIWANSAYYETNTERNNFRSLLTRWDAKVGLHLIPLYKNAWFDPYVAYIGVASKDDSYWNNNSAFGAGLRFKPFAFYSGNTWYNEWIKDIKIFADSLTISYSTWQSSVEAEKKPLSDTRIGLDLWHEWNQFKPENPKVLPDPKVPWSELWANLAWRKTNFFEEDFNNFIFFYQQKLGVQNDLGETGASFEPYLKFDIVLSGKKKDKFGNTLAWLNNAVYGAGIRLRPFKYGNFFGSNLPFLSKFKIFTEILSISWIDGKDSDSRPDTDLRFGIEFTYGR